MRNEARSSTGAAQELQQPAHDHCGQAPRGPTEMNVECGDRWLEPRLESIGAARLPGAITAEQGDNRTAAREPMALGAEPAPESFRERKDWWTGAMRRQGTPQRCRRGHAAPRCGPRLQRRAAASEQ